MRYITKSREPNSLTTYRSTPAAEFNSCNKGDIRTNLLIEQYHICAYCMQRISTDWNDQLNKPKTEIEHYKSQNRHPNLTLNYSNMLGVCNGNAGKAEHQLICDKAKSRFDKADPIGKDLIVDPQNDTLVNTIKYTSEGDIFSDNDSIENDLNEVLNLNEPNLKRYRAFVYEKVREKTRRIVAQKSGNKVRRLLQEKRLWIEPNINNRLRPFAEVAVYVIDKRIRKLNL